jgi:hypothetical protein
MAKMVRFLLYFFPTIKKIKCFWGLVVAQTGES